jgi:hypothetical protein
MDMEYEDARARLLNHGNLMVNGANALPDEASFLFALWQAEREKVRPNINSHYEDMLACLEVVNRYLNGDSPSEIAFAEKQAPDRSLVNAMWCVIHTGWERHRRWELAAMFDQGVRDDLAQKIWRISCAWGGVLDGDIDSLTEHVRNEEIASS